MDAYPSQCNLANQSFPSIDSNKETIPGFVIILITIISVLLTLFLTYKCKKLVYST